MATPTEQDRVRAFGLIAAHVSNQALSALIEESVAEALAHERETASAPAPPPGAELERLKVAHANCYVRRGLDHVDEKESPWCWANCSGKGCAEDFAIQALVATSTAGVDSGGAELEAVVRALREALEAMMQAFDPEWPGACPQGCFDTSDGHGYSLQEAAKEQARAALARLAALTPRGEESGG